MGGDNSQVRQTVRDVEGQQPAAGSSRQSDTATDSVTEPATLSELDASSPTPRFLEDERASKRWKWVPYPVRRSLSTAARWVRGPPDPRPYKIQPLLPKVQRAPLWLLDRFMPEPRFRKWRIVLYFAWLGLWLMTFALVMRKGLVSTEVEVFGEPSDIGCGNTYWLSDNTCGLDGNDCRPFNDTAFAFRCPANCASYQVLNYRAVGDQELIYQTLVVGGPANSSDARPIYRGDSYICSAALHAGIISNAGGGCGVVELIGKQKQYIGSDQNGIQSVSFDSYFPISYTFQKIDCQSSDMRWPLLAVSVVFSVFLSLFVQSPAPFFFGVFSGIFWQVGLASDPPNHQSVADLISIIVGRYMPAMFAAWVIFDKMGVRRTLRNLTAQIEKTILWLGGCWVGALENYTFAWIPIQRLTPHDLQQQPGARVALAFIILILLVVAVTQIYFFRQEGRLTKYLRLYLLLGLGLVILALLPDLSLRIHHYIIGLLLLPGTSMQTRPSLLYQGLLVGLFINGIARWDWDAILQTAFQLRGDANLGSPLPELLVPVVALGANVSNITFTWKAPPGIRYDGISALVNDVERFRRYFADLEDGDSTARDEFVWERKGGGLGMKEYFRFAFMEGSTSDDYTKAGVWNEKGEWVQMAEGPSRVRRRGVADEEVRVVVRKEGS